jgi:hypothetical protein
MASSYQILDQVLKKRLKSSMVVVVSWIGDS